MSKIQLIGNIVKSCERLPYIKPAITDVKHSCLPEYLYHFTSKDSAEEIIKTGKILAHDDGTGLDFAGVFMLELENFIKNWTKLKVDNNYGSFNFFNFLFSQAAKGSERIACFRLPVIRMNKNLMIRDQGNLVKATELVDAGKDATSLITKVDKAELYKLYHAKGHSVEFIHTGDINITKNDLVGITELPDDLRDIPMGIKPLKSAFETLKYLFIKQPETELLKSV